MENNKEILLISVGGNPNQVIKSIEFNKPKYIIFFCSNETYEKAEDILNIVKKNMEIKQSEKIVTEDGQDIGESYISIIRKLPEILKLWNKTFEDIVVDYTPGTKSMTAALVLATIKECNTYSYIGGSKRDKDGLGVVIDGNEELFCQENPWNKLAIGEFEIIDILFSKARYIDVFEKFNSIKKIVDSRLRQLYSILAEIVQAYYKWDNFCHKEAMNILKQNVPKLNYFKIIQSNDFNNLIYNINKNMEWLENLVKLKQNNKIEAYIEISKDLISNAIRRGELESKFDDAVARLYSAIEKIIKAKLLEKGIDNSKTQTEQIPTQLLAKFEKHKYIDKKDQKEYFKYGLQASCEILYLLDEDFKQKYDNTEKELRQLMNIRDQSVLAHGTQPVSKDLYEKMLKIVLEFLEVDKEDVSKFPELNINKWGYMI